MDYRFADCRHDLADPDRGRELYRAGHIPGAAFLDLKADLSDLTVSAEVAGRHPLPSPEAFAAAASRAGIGPGTMVVGYDQADGGAARLWWLLRHFGHDDVAILDGGIGAWLGPLRAGDEEIEPAQFTARRRDDDTISTDELRERLGDDRLTVLDARLPERYSGETEPFDPTPGHIPGAVNAPFTGALDPRLSQADELAVYCGSGVTACVVVHALHRAGRTDARLYPGSFSEWSRKGLPVERGSR
jgi:thiosulfate/3-mercaptopyruvate sulfurtransferase